MPNEYAVLWLDNDPANIDPLVKVLRASSVAVTVCKTVSAAAAALETRRYDLLILDVMIPIIDGELVDYPAGKTDGTLATGLLFYQRSRRQLETAKTQVLVMTVRIDRAIAAAFASAGLAPAQFATKMELRDAKRFRERVMTMLRSYQEAPS